MKTDTPPSLLKGTLDMLILKALIDGPKHGYGVAARLHDLSAETLRIEEGSLYPALHRLLKKGFLRSSLGRSENNRKARFYQLTKKGDLHLKKEVETWGKLSAAITRIIQAPPEASFE